MKWLVCQTFDLMAGRLGGWWFEARLVSTLLCCFFRQETLLFIVSLHPTECINRYQRHIVGNNPVMD